jgi:ATP-dependent RNA helicase DDX41
MQSIAERAKGVTVTKEMPAIGQWRPYLKHRSLTHQQAESIREKFFIDTNGQGVPAPIKKFEDMRLPQGILNGLKNKSIERPTQIQMQGIPAALAGRDLIGIAFTGSGKTMVFLLPMILQAISHQFKSPIQRNEGPFSLMLCPSRELAHQTNEILIYFLDALHEENRARRAERRQSWKDGTQPFPGEIRSVLVIGGQDKRIQTNAAREGVHMAVGTPGRLNDILNQKRMHLKQCTFLALDEADRMMDAGFEEEIRATLDHFHGQRQTLLFSATMLAMGCNIEVGFRVHFVRKWLWHLRRFEVGKWLLSFTKAIRSRPLYPICPAV